MIDHELLFRLIHEQRWIDAAVVLHRHHDAVTDDLLLHRASQAFVECVTAVLANPNTAPDEDLLEKLFLLHQGRFLSLPAELFEQVVGRLVETNAHRPEAALAYARYCPSHPTSAKVLSELGDPVRDRIAHDQAPAIEVVASRSDAADASRPLLRSAQEAVFFDAVREVFPENLVCPNVALSAVLDYELLKRRLSQDERRYFFRALVDCVVFDGDGRFCPRHFFEIDSPLHEDAARKKRDGHKDRILAAAGQRLFRIRTRNGAASSDQFARLIRQTVARP